MENERNLDGTERNDQQTHEIAFVRKVLDHIWHFTEISQEKRPTNDKSANNDYDSGPLQDIAKTPHRKSEKLTLGKAQTFDPSQTNRDQIYLNVNTEEVFKNKCYGINRCGESQ